MLVIHQHLPARSPRQGEELRLIYETRSKSRLCCFVADGEEVGLFLERGQPPLADGDCLEVRDGRLVQIAACPERLLYVTCASPLELTRAAYHLSNRHVVLQVGNGWLRLLDDYVLKTILEQPGAAVGATEMPFQPEHGAYGGGYHRSHHDEAELSHAPCLHQFGVRRRTAPECACVWPACSCRSAGTVIPRVRRRPSTMTGCATPRACGPGWSASCN